MRTPDELEEYIRKLLVRNNLDININQHPELISAGRDLGYDTGELAAVVGRVYESTDWRPYKLIEDQVINSSSFSQGRFFNEHARPIVEKVKEDLSPAEAVAYIIHIITNQPNPFSPRLHPAPDTGSFRDPWMTDDAWDMYKKQQPVEWCGVEVITLEQLGEVCFSKREDTLQLIQNKLYLPPTVMMLTRSAARTQPFEKIFDDIKDVETRYLTIIYRLYNELPFRFRGAMYKTLADVMTEACQSHEALSQLEAIYSRGYIHIWQQEAQTALAGHLPAGLGKNGFLELLYTVNRLYPFYLNGQRYDSPAHLVTVAKTSGAIWKDIFQAIDNRELHVWFGKQGQEQWCEGIDKQNAAISDSGFYNDEERKLASVQAFINLVDETATLPAIVATPKELSFINSEASHVIESNISLQLSTDGFVKASLRLEPTIPGISLDRTTVKFYGLVDNKQTDIKLTIDPMQLQKDTRYDFQIVVNSVYQDLRIPVTVSVVFPQKAYITELLKWSGMSAAFFLVLGWLAGAFQGASFYMGMREYLPWGLPWKYVEPVSIAYLLLLVTLGTGLFLSIRYIRRKYKTNLND